MRVRRLTGWQSPSGWTQPGDVVEMDDALGALHVSNGDAERTSDDASITPPDPPGLPADTDAHLAITTTLRSDGTPLPTGAPVEAAASDDVADDVAEDRADLIGEIRGLRTKADAVALGELHGITIAPDTKLADMKAELMSALAAGAPVEAAASDDVAG